MRRNQSKNLQQEIFHQNLGHLLPVCHPTQQAHAFLLIHAPLSKDTVLSLFIPFKFQTIVFHYLLKLRSLLKPYIWRKLPVSPTIEIPNKLRAQPNNRTPSSSNHKELLKA